MARPKHNGPCHCGSGKKYRLCHLNADREAKAAAAEAQAASESSAPVPAPRAVKPPWLHALPWGLGAAGVGGGLYLALTSEAVQGGLAVSAGSVVIAVLIALFTDPPPPKDDAGDPGAINFGR